MVGIPKYCGNLVGIWWEFLKMWEFGGNMVGGLGIPKNVGIWWEYGGNEKKKIRGLWKVFALLRYFVILFENFRSINGVVPEKVFNKFYGVEFSQENFRNGSINALIKLRWEMIFSRTEKTFLIFSFHFPYHLCCGNILIIFIILCCE